MRQALVGDRPKAHGVGDLSGAHEESSASTKICPRAGTPWVAIVRRRRGSTCPVLTKTVPRRIGAEHVVVLGPIPTEAAQALLEARVRAQGAEPPDPEACGPLVEAVEGWPLALELLAERLRLLQADEVLERLAASPLALLRSAQGPARHRDLGAALAQAWAGLSAEAARLAAAPERVDPSEAGALAELRAAGFLVPDGEGFRTPRLLAAFLRERT